METQSLGRARRPPARSHIVYTDQKGRNGSTGIWVNQAAYPTCEWEAILFAALLGTGLSHSYERILVVHFHGDQPDWNFYRIPYADKTTPDPLLNANVRDPNSQAVSAYSNFKVGIYGWRKKCLYILIMSLLFMMIVNLALTLWVLKVMDFNTEGMGQLRIVPGGLQLLGQAFVLDSLFASTIKSRRGQPIVIESSRNFSIHTRDKAGFIESRLFIGNDRLECEASLFVIRDARGSLVMSASSEEVTIGAETLRLTGSGGVTFDASVQVPAVRAPAGKQLVLESPTRSLEVRAAHNIAIESRAGDISATCLTTFRVQSVAGAIRLDAPSIFFPKLKSALPLPPSAPHSRDPHHHDIYQLCVCASGKLFLAPPHGACAARDDSLICR